MPTIAIISDKGGAGKTTLALHLAAAAQASGAAALIVDTDPQATASQWAAWRRDAPPHADSAARAAVEVADLVLIPCRRSAFDLVAIQTTAKLVQLLRKPAFVVFTPGPPNAPFIYAEAGELVESYCTPPSPVILSDRAAYRPRQCRGPDRHGSRADGQGCRGSPRLLRVDVSTTRHADTPFKRGRIMSRKPSFANLRGPAASIPTTSAPLTPDLTHLQDGQGRGVPRPVSREGRKQIAGFLTPDMSFGMHTLARRQGRSLQALIAEAFNDVLRKHGESPIGK